jgi:ATP-dependent DNA helicase PIF1
MEILNNNQTTTIMNDLQQNAFENMKQGKSVFLTGQGGTGKTFLLLQFIEWLKNQYVNEPDAYAVTSTTGISAELIDGVTLHSYLGIETGEDTVEYYINKMKKYKDTKLRWTCLKVLLIDEISMLNPNLFDKLDAIAKLLRRSDEPFGGIQVVLSGDFCQLPVVNCKKFCFEANNWKNVVQEIFYFTENIRQNDELFQEILGKIRMGICDKQVIKILKKRIRKDYVNDHNILPTILYSTNKNVDEYNDRKLHRLIETNNKPYEYTSRYEFKNILNIPLTTERQQFLISKIDKSNKVPHKLTLTVGTQIMITKNIKELGLVNGSRGVVSGFNSSGNPIVQFLKGVPIEIKPFSHTWELKDIQKNVITKIQLPLRLAWAITIHKSQGMSLDYVRTNLGQSIFECGQSYVVLSRVRCLEGLFLEDISFDKIKANKKVIKFYDTLDK